MKATPFSILVSLFFLFTAQKCEETMQDFSIDYKSHTSHIQIVNKLTNYTETKHKYSNPTSSTPSGSTVQKRVNNKMLTDTQAKDLLAFIQTSGFEALKTEYGAPTNQRYYPYSITINLGNRTKEVIFRSNPSYEKKPVAFEKVEKYLLDLMNKL